MRRTASSASCMRSARSAATWVLVVGIVDFSVALTDEIVRKLPGARQKFIQRGPFKPLVSDEHR